MTLERAPELDNKTSEHFSNTAFLFHRCPCCLFRFENRYIAPRSLTRGAKVIARQLKFEHNQFFPFVIPESIEGTGTKIATKGMAITRKKAVNGWINGLAIKPSTKIRSIIK